MAKRKKQKSGVSSVVNPSPWLVGALGGGLPAATGLAVTPVTAIQCTAVYACVRSIAEDLAKLPLCVYRRQSNGKRGEPAPDHYLQSLLDEPNGWMTSFDLREVMQWNCGLDGNGYAYVDWVDGRVERLIPLSPNYTRVQVAPTGQPFYLVTDPRLETPLMLPRGQVLHVRGPSLDGYVGLSPIRVAREAIGLALATERHGARLFSNGAQLGGVIKTSTPLSDDAYSRMEGSWKRKYTGIDNAHAIAILEQGADFVKVAMTSEDAQFLETRSFQIRDIARLYRVPPHKIGDLDKATFSNIEQQNLEYATDCLMAWAARWEKVLTQTLLLPWERQIYCIGLDFDALLRADMKTRYGSYAQGLTAGFLTVNEVREMEGLHSVEGGDILRAPLNTAPLPTDDDLPPDDRPLT